MKMTAESEDVLKALSSSTRRTIMKQISEKGSATYTEIMHVLKLDPALMSGTFNYHLKELNEAGLIQRTNGEYRITDLGKKALILVDQVAKDVKVDQYGVLSAVMSMSPSKELSLFSSQMGMMVGTIFSILCLIPFLIEYGTGSLVFWLSGITLVLAVAVTLAFVAKMVDILRKFKVGFSVIVFLSSNWFFIRSPNRNRFFIITMALVGTVITGMLAILLPYTGEVQLFSIGWYGLIVPALCLSILTGVLYLRAKQRANRLEEDNHGQ